MKPRPTPNFRKRHGVAKVTAAYNPEEKARNKEQERNQTLERGEIEPCPFSQRKRRKGKKFRLRFMAPSASEKKTKEIGNVRNDRILQLKGAHPQAF